MKAYQVKITMNDSNPLIWRRVIMPAGATFRRLHDCIQSVLNFQDYHLYEFDLSKDQMVVTNNEEAYMEHQYYKKHRKEWEEHIKTLPPEFVKFEQIRLERAKKVVRQPTSIKIDQYLEGYGELEYVYDFGDNWKITIALEKIVDDYYYGYPTLLDGEGTAPPEDVGGFTGYKDFLQIYNNPKNPQYKEIRTWAKEQYYREYDPEFINSMLKSIKYKKTEWEKIEDRPYYIYIKP